MTFDELLDAANLLPLEDQDRMLSILRGRVHDAKREALIERVREAERERDAGLGIEMTPEEFAAALAR